MWENKLTPMEALVVLFMIKIGRENGNGLVDVNALARALKRSKSRIRLLLNNLKSKGIVIDIGKIVSEETEETKGYLGPKDFEEIMKIIMSPNRGVEKQWTLADVNVLDDKAVIDFIKAKPEFDRYFGLEKVMKFLGINYGR